jgi:hypothetical protein
MFELPLNWVDPELGPLEPFHVIRHPQVYEFFEAATTRFETSRNWCGATIVPDRGNQFVQIYSEWKVPKPSVPPHGTQGKKYYSVAWIGLDGDRRYIDSSLPQVGTQQNVTRGADGQDQTEYYAWFQWWAPRRIKPDFWRIGGIPIDGGDDVMGLIWVVDSTHVVVVFRNFTTNKITAFPEEAPGYLCGRDDLSVKYRPSISGATAEWIVENPTVEVQPNEDPPDLEPFADYRQVYFRHCVAGMAEKPGQPTSEKVLTAPRYKRMYQVLADPSRTRFISMPKRGASATELEVDYGGF